VRPRVLLADDHLPLLTALKRLLQGECEVVACVATVADLLQHVLVCRPDVVVLDIKLPDGTGIDACRQLKAVVPDVAVIMFSAMDDPDIRAAALEAGAEDLISKHTIHTLLSAIRDAWARKNPMPDPLPERSDR